MEFDEKVIKALYEAAVKLSRAMIEAECKGVNFDSVEKEWI